MADLLIALYDRTGGAGRVWDSAPPEGVRVRRALAHERPPLEGWVERRFGGGWAGEVAVALGRQPAACFLAEATGEILGFGCYDIAFRGFFGPLGVAEGARGRGIGAALLGAALEAMWQQGYAYAVVGAAGAPGFYRRVAGAQEIPGSESGPYPARLRGSAG